MIIGITVLPARFTRVAPAGTRTSAAAPASTIFVPSTTSVAVLDHASVAHDQPRAFERRYGLRRCGYRESGNQASECDCGGDIHPAHGNLQTMNLGCNLVLSRERSGAFAHVAHSCCASQTRLFMSSAACKGCKP